MSLLHGGRRQFWEDDMQFEFWKVSEWKARMGKSYEVLLQDIMILSENMDLSDDS